MFNKYAYVGNDPMNATDPDGEFLNFVAKFVADVALEVAIQAISGEEINLGSAVKGAALGVLDPTKTARKIIKLGRAANKARKTRQLKRADSARPNTSSGPSCALCFVAGTLVETSAGYRPIEDLEIGDLVLSKDVETGDVAYKEVVDLIPAHDRMIWELNVIGSEGLTEMFETTDDHPWWIVGEGWLVTRDLKAGMQAMSADGSLIEIASVADTDRTDSTYNLTVADYNTYFVGKQRVLVHNCKIDRYPKNKESAQRLDRKSKEAQAVGRPHGVSGSKKDLGSGASSANKSTLEKAGFAVTDTGPPGHVTIELPNPVTKEDAKIFNKIFGRK